MTTASLLNQWFEEVWNQSNEAFIDEMMHKDVIIHGIDSAGTTTGIDNFHQFYKNFRVTFPNVHILLEPLVHDDEVATAYCTVTGKSVTSREVSFTGLAVGRFKDGKLVESWNNFDFLKMYQQLGHIMVEPIKEPNKL